MKARIKYYWNKLINDEKYADFIIVGIVLVALATLGMIATNDRKEAMEYCMNNNTYEYCYEITK